MRKSARILCETWQAFSLDSVNVGFQATGIRSSTSLCSTLHIYVVIEIYNEVCVILMLVTKRKWVGQSKGKGVSVRDMYAPSNDNETEQASSLVVRTGSDWKGGIRMLGSKEKSRYRGHLTYCTNTTNSSCHVDSRPVLRW